jgi:hypothetical protein
MTWDRMKKRDDINTVIKAQKFCEFIEEQFDCQLPLSDE